MRNRHRAEGQALLLAVGVLDLAKGLYFLRHYPQAALVLSWTGSRLAALATASLWLIFPGTR